MGRWNHGSAALDVALVPVAAASGVESQPLYFGPEDRPLFGWLHAPAAASRPALGLVICNPFGNEAICAHRSLRHLAERAADAGIPALRFDYDGTGDSAGHDFDPDRLSAWLASVGLAADTLRELTGIERLCFFGIRLGAALATLAAAARKDVAGLATLAPVVDGKSYIRELRMLRRAMDSKRNITRDVDSEVLEAAGFALSAPTQASLSAIDLQRLERRPAPRVLILDRAELPGRDDWASHLRGQGANVHRTSVRGYTEMMLDSHESIVPEEIIDTAVTWLIDIAGDLTPVGAEGDDFGLSAAAEKTQGVSRRRAAVPRSSPDPVLGEAPQVAIEELAVHFGDLPKLFGIVSAPTAGARRAGRPTKAILLLNSGAVHRVGPNRLYVALARHLSRLGHVVLRMDIAGIGDSAPRPGEPENIVYTRQALQDVRSAIEYLQRDWGAAEVRAVGLCSGAYHAFKAAVAQMPLSGVILINPLTFFWKEGMSLKYPEYRIADDISRYRSNMLSLAAWRKLLSGRVDLWEVVQVLGRRARALALKPVRAAARLVEMPLSDDLPTELLKIASAAIDLQFVFAAADPGLELLRNQGGRTAQRLRSLGQLHVELIADADHTFTDLATRTSLAAMLAQRLHAPSDPAASVSPSLP
jgi:alpha-beta hydrolase superfamily lysophospholipase